MSGFLFGIGRTYRPIVINSAAVSICRLSVIINKVAGNIAYRRFRRVINSAAVSICRLSVIIDKVAGVAPPFPLPFFLIFILIPS